MKWHAKAKLVQEEPQFPEKSKTVKKDMQNM